MINIKIRLFFLCTISIISTLTFSKEPNQMTKEIISTENAPQAIGPYSQAVKAGNLIFISGQVPLNPKTGDLVTESIEDQARQVLDNVKSICESAGQSLDDIVKISIFLTDLNNFAVVNDVMKEYFSEPYPARATVEVSGLPLGVNVKTNLNQNLRNQTKI
jgi:2-iminobutanoate/2-iminopropanoate deaminase